LFKNIVAVCNLILLATGIYRYTIVKFTIILKSRNLMSSDNIMFFVFSLSARDNDRDRSRLSDRGSGRGGDRFMFYHLITTFCDLSFSRKTQKRIFNPEKWRHRAEG